MNDQVMHSPTRSGFESLRAGLWLVVELIDDLLELVGDRDDMEALTSVRNRAFDMLFVLRKLEKDWQTGSPSLPD